MPIKLKDGRTTEDPRLDRIPEFDERSRNYPVSLHLRKVTRQNRVWRLPRYLMGDQGREGACTEFGISHVLAAYPLAQALRILRAVRNGHRIYWPAQQQDPWPGGSYPGADPTYEGTSELSALKVARDLGFFSEFSWAFGIDQLVDGVVSHGPANLALDWTRGMARPRPDGLIRNEGDVIGGHDVAMIGVLFDKRLPGDPRGTKRDLAVIAQSWGLDHGDRGRVYLPLSDLEEQLKDDGTAAFIHGEKKLTALP